VDADDAQASVSLEVDLAGIERDGPLPRLHEQPALVIDPRTDVVELGRPAAGHAGSRPADMPALARYVRS
jgi:hypothetical protein